MKLLNTPALYLIALIMVVAACQQAPSGIIDTSNYSSPVKVACVGNSITYGAGIDHRDSLSYPAQLQRLLGDNWEVKNFGVSGRTLLSKGDRPYINEAAYAEAKAFLPDVVLIKLGTNDTKPVNWKYHSEFKSDYKALIHSFQSLESNPIVVLLKAVPAFPERWGISDSIIQNGINPMIEELAKEMNLPFIDLHSPLVDQDHLFPDQIHPNSEGAAFMARIIYAQLTGDIL